MLPCSIGNDVGGSLYVSLLSNGLNRGLVSVKAAVNGVGGGANAGVTLSEDKASPFLGLKNKIKVIAMLF